MDAIIYLLLGLIRPEAGDLFSRTFPRTGNFRFNTVNHSAQQQALAASRERRMAVHVEKQVSPSPLRPLRERGLNGAM